MLRRALSRHHHHPLCIVHGQRLSRATATLPSRAPPDLQNPTAASSSNTRHQPFSTSLVCRLREGGASEESPRLGNSQTSSSHVVGTSGGPSPEARADGGDVRVADPDVVVGNSTNMKRVLRRGDDDDTTQAKASPAQANRSSTRPGTPTRTLRPLLIPPAFPPSLLLSTKTTPITEQSPSSTNQDQNKQKANDNKATDEKTDAGSSSFSSSTTVAVGGLPPGTLKTDVRTVFQRFGEVTRVLVHAGGRRADVVFADVESVTRSLHAYAEQPLWVRGRSVVVFRGKHSAGVNAGGAVASRGPFYVRNEQDGDDGANDGAIFVSNFPAGTTQEQLSEVFRPLGKYKKFVMRPGSKYAYFVYSSDDRVEDILRVHERVPITFRGQSLRIERTKNRPHNLSTDSEEEHLRELEKPASSALVEELKRTVPGWKGSCGPSRVLWVGRLPSDMPREALTNFWSRLGCVIEVRTSTNGFAHVEFASVEEAVRAARQGVPHGFRYEERLLDVDFAPWVFYLGPLYRSVYISGWSASDGRHALLQWASDIPNIVGATVLPPFRGEKRWEPRGAFLHFRSIDDARAGLRALDGRKGPSGSGSETLHLTLSRRSAVHSDRLWRWAYAEERGGSENNAYLEGEWAGLGFGTGQELSSSSSSLPVGTGKTGMQAAPGTRGGRRSVWKEPAWETAERDEEDTLFSHPLWTRAGGGGGGGGGEEDPRLLRAEVEREVEEGHQVAQRAFLRREGRRRRPTNGDSG